MKEAAKDETYRGLLRVSLPHQTQLLTVARDLTRLCISRYLRKHERSAYKLAHRQPQKFTYLAYLFQRDHSLNIQPPWTRIFEKGASPSTRPGKVTKPRSDQMNTPNAKSSSSPQKPNALSNPNETDPAVEYPTESLNRAPHRSNNEQVRTRSATTTRK